MAKAEAECELLTKNKVKKNVTFNNEDSIEQYTSPYCDPSFMSSESLSSRSVNKYQHVYLNHKERIVVETFYNYFEVSFDPTTSVTHEQIHNWLNSELERHGEKKWSKHGKKWTYVVKRLNLSLSLWKRRDQPLVASPITSSPSSSSS